MEMLAWIQINILHTKCNTGIQFQVKYKVLTYSIF